MVQENSNRIISKMNYKDILIILGLWYLMAVLHVISKEISFQSPLINDLFHFLFILSGRFIYLAIIIFYLTYFYPVSFKELGFNFLFLKQQLLSSLSLILFLFSAILLLVNIPLSYGMKQQFSPLFYLVSPEEFIRSLLPLIIIFLSSIIIGLSEQFLLSKIIFELFNLSIFSRLFSLLLAALLYSVILLDFSPPRILMNFITASISLILYRRYDSILASSLFMAGYYSIYIVYIYGWNFIKF